jgi:hypothetical protein
MTNDYIISYLIVNEDVNDFDLKTLTSELEYFFCEDKETCFGKIIKWLTEESVEIGVLLSECEFKLGTFNWEARHPKLGVISFDDLAKQLKGDVKLNEEIFDFWWELNICSISEKNWKELFE